MKTRSEPRTVNTMAEEIVSDLRCRCGKLLAKWRADGLEVKCQGCKGLLLIPFSEIRGWPGPRLGPLCIAFARPDPTIQRAKTDSA